METGQRAVNPRYFKRGSNFVGKQVLTKRYEACHFAGKEMMAEALRNTEIIKARATIAALQLVNNVRDQSQVK